MPQFAQGLKRPVWVAAGSTTNGVATYGTPALHQWNWRGMSTGVDMMTFGAEYMDYRRATMPNSEVVGLKRLDRVWMDSTPSNPSDPFAKDADFYVYGVNKGAGGVAEVLFKRLSNDGT